MTKMSYCLVVMMLIIQASFCSAAAFRAPYFWELPCYEHFHQYMDDKQFEEAYNYALPMVTQIDEYSNGDKKLKLIILARALRSFVDNGTVRYSTKAEHYNDPYGYFVSNAVSCAGCARTTGMCLNMLGIPFEHVNENQWKHQWCRVNVNGEYWICDAYGAYVGPELTPYEHPMFDGKTHRCINYLYDNDGEIATIIQ